jgi:hypothetical protein
MFALLFIKLDKSASMESLEKVTIYFRQLYNIFLAQEKPDCTSVMSCHTRTLLAASGCLTLDIGSAKFALQASMIMNSACCSEYLMSITVLN